MVVSEEEGLSPAGSVIKMISAPGNKLLDRIFCGHGIRGK